MTLRMSETRERFRALQRQSRTMPGVRSYCRPVLLLLACSVFGTAHADTDDAKAAYLSGNFPVAQKEYRKAAELGHPQAQFNLGVMYYRGDGFERSAILALAWMELAQDNGLEGIEDQIAAVKRQAGPEAQPIVDALRSQFGPDAVAKNALPQLEALTADVDFETPASADKALRKLPALRSGGESVDMRGYPDFMRARPRPVDRLDALPTEQTELAKNETPEGFLGVQRLPDKFGALTADLLVAPDGSVRDVEVVVSLPKEYANRDWLVAAARFRYPRLESAASPVSRVAHVDHVSGHDALVDQMTARVWKDLAQKLKPCVDEGSPGCQFYAAVIPMPPEIYPRNTGLLLLQAAQGGFAKAQYLVGRRLAYGRFREPDKARKWLQLALENGVTRAGIPLARLEIESNAAGSWERARDLLAPSYDAVDEEVLLPLAALYAACPDARLRNPEKALSLVDHMRWRQGASPTTREVTAAAAAAMGDFKRATKEQQQAIALARELGWDVSALTARLANYSQAHQPWFGDLLAF